MKVLKLMQDVWGLNHVGKTVKRLAKYLEDHPEVAQDLGQAIYTDGNRLIQALKVAETGNRLRMLRLKKILENTEIEVNPES